ncbi:MAG: CsgG/HfaB family protein [Spirochaetaceae bacterium]|jgi:hypothetical protein|nr:CsgG/HfaB family protein [Spirochaetaceae bacterium]
MMKRVCAAWFAVVFFAGFVSAQSGGTSEITVQRAASRINQGFRERIYIDGRQQLTLTNGGSGKIVVPRGDHTIHAELSSLTTAKVQFTAGASPLAFVVTPYALDNFVIERSGGPQAPAARIPESAAAAGTALQTFDDPTDTSVEASLSRAANAIMTRVPPRSKMAIVYVTARDAEISEFIAGELEFIMVEKGFILIDRSELDRIRREQAFQMSGEVDDTQAVSIGKIAGANIIITGSVTGTGDLRRLRLRALSTETGQVLAVASERY